MAEAKKGRGCLFYGCLTLIVLAILIIVGIFFGVRFGFKYLRDHFTSTKPVAVAPIALPPDDGARVAQRVDDFKKAVRNRTPTAPLELNSDDLDYIVRTTSQQGLKDSIHLTITNGHIHAQMSLPLDMSGPAFFGRFFNGDADLSVALRNDGVAFKIDHASVNGQPVPGPALDKVNKNIVWNPEPNDPNAGVVPNLERIEVTDDKVVLYPKSK